MIQIMLIIGIIAKINKYHNNANRAEITIISHWNKIFLFIYFEKYV